MNVGRSSEDACEVRVEEIYRIPAEQGLNPLILVDHDPRALKWVGRSAKAIALNAGAFDFVDLGVRRSDTPHRVYLDFAERGHINLDRDKRVTSAFRICGTVYGRRAIPKRFTFKLTWDPDSDFGSVEIGG